MPSSRQDNAYREMVIGKLASLIQLDEAIDWIKSNLNPEDVFDERDLRQWADENGFVNEE
jgi:hypothetical protein